MIILFILFYFILFSPYPKLDATKLTVAFFLLGFDRESPISLSAIQLDPRQCLMVESIGFVFFCFLKEKNKY
jgi:hypothetical protein